MIWNGYKDSRNLPENGRVSGRQIRLTYQSSFPFRGESRAETLHEVFRLYETIRLRDGRQIIIVFPASLLVYLNLVDLFESGLSFGGD